MMSSRFFLFNLLVRHTTYPISWFCFISYTFLINIDIYVPLRDFSYSCCNILSPSLAFADLSFSSLPQHTYIHTSPYSAASFAFSFTFNFTFSFNFLLTYNFIFLLTFNFTLFFNFLLTFNFTLNFLSCLFIFVFNPF